MANSTEGKEISKQNSVKHGLYLHFSDFFPCNLCVNREKCKDFVPGGTCSIDRDSFHSLMEREIDEIEIIKGLINYHTVRLNRATEQLYKHPDNIELTRISAEIRNLIQTLHIIKSRKGDKYVQANVLQPLSDKSQLRLFQEE